MSLGVSKLELWATIGIAIVAAVLVGGRMMGDVGGRPSEGVDGSPLPDTGFSMLPPQEVLNEWYEIGHLVGDPGARIQVIEFGNFSCMFCRALFHSLDTLSLRYPGQIAIRWLHWVEADRRLLESNRIAALAMECAADQGRFEHLWRDGFSVENPPRNRQLVFEAAERAGIPDMSLFAACLDSGRHETTLDRHIAAGTSAGIEVTPTWYLNGGRIRGAPSTATIDSLIRAIMRPAAAE